MSRGDQTGPEGRGPRTGRALGFCAGFNSPGFTRGTPRGGGGFGWSDSAPQRRNFNQSGFGRGFGRGRGFGFRRFFGMQEQVPMEREIAQPTKQEQIKILDQERKDIEAELKEINKEIESLKKQKIKK